MDGMADRTDTTDSSDISDAVAAAAAADPVPSPGRLVQGRIYRDGALGRRPLVPVTPDRLAAAAQRRVKRRGWGHVARAAGAKRAARAHQAPLERYPPRAPGPPRPRRP